MSSNKKSRLSEEVLEMHFMRSTRQKLEDTAKKQKLTEIEEAFRGKKEEPVQRFISNKNKVILCPEIGYTQLQNLRYGRFAFNGANDEITKIQQEEDEAQFLQMNPKKEIDNEDIFKDVTDAEMAKSSFAAARSFNARGGFIEPAPEVLNIYVDESTAPEPQLAPESQSASNSKPTSSLQNKAPSSRFAPYRNNQRKLGKKKR